MIPLLASGCRVPLLHGGERVKTGLLAVFFLMAAFGAKAGNLETLKTTATLYVVAMKSAARSAMPTLLKLARGGSSGTAEEEELVEMFRGFGEDRDEEAAAALENRLRTCPASSESAKALSAIDRARQVAEQFVEDFGQMEGV